MAQRWIFKTLFDSAAAIFKKKYSKKRSAHHNHEIHDLKRSIKQWLPTGIQALIDGTYSPRLLRRWQFQDEVVDSLYLPDYILQHLLLQVLKPTFKHIINPNCFHLLGPSSGVKLASDKVNQALETGVYQYIIRADIKPYYSSIPKAFGF